MHISRKSAQNCSLGIYWETSKSGWHGRLKACPLTRQGYENKEDGDGLRGQIIRNPWSGQAWNRTRSKPGNSFDGTLNSREKTTPPMREFGAEMTRWDVRLDEPAASQPKNRTHMRPKTRRASARVLATYALLAILAGYICINWCFM